MTDPFADIIALGALAVAVLSLMFSLRHRARPRFVVEWPDDAEWHHDSVPTVYARIMNEGDAMARNVRIDVEPGEVQPGMRHWDELLTFAVGQEQLELLPLYNVQIVKDDSDVVGRRDRAKNPIEFVGTSATDFISQPPVIIISYAGRRKPLRFTREAYPAPTGPGVPASPSSGS